MGKNILAASMIAFAALAQTPAPDKSLTFEVASIKPAQPPKPDAQGRMFMRGPSGGPGSKDPGRISYPFVTLKNILMTAYNVKNYQVSGPSLARLTNGSTLPPPCLRTPPRSSFKSCCKICLLDRFQMSVHREKKELPMYSLVVTKSWRS